MGNFLFPAFLLVLFCTAVVLETKELVHMGMFPEAADYSFHNCRKEMLQMVTKVGGLLETELDNNTDFKAMWQDRENCKISIPEVVPEHMKALQSYVDADPTFHSIFKRLIHTKSGRSSTFRDDFPFKSLFFLLTDTMQLLKNNCYTVYSGTEKKYTAKIGDKVRFESFFPAKLIYSDATEDAATDEGTVFNITSCSGINLDKVCESEEIDLLISPTEVFTVKNIRTVGNQGDHYNEITLMHLENRSSSNCSGLLSMSEESKESSTSFLTSRLQSLIPSLFMSYFYMLTL